MTLFNYRAKNRMAENVSGTIVAETKDEAVERIHQMGLVPVSIDDDKQDTSALPATGRPSVQGKELYNFSRQLASLLKAGMPLLRALETIARQATNSYFRNIISQIGAGVKDGRTFADCLSQHPKIFSPLYAAMVRAGEESGQLREILLSMAAYQHERNEISSQVRVACLYPLMMAGLGVATVIFVLTFVMPKITVLFADMQENLPLPTIILIQATDFLKRTGLFLLAGGIIAVYALFKWFQSGPGHFIGSQMQLSLPFVRTMVIHHQLAHFSRTMELLLKSGIMILKALQLSIPVVPNDILRRELEKCSENLREGQPLGRTFRNSPFLPLMFGELIALGEESGALTSALHDIAQEYDSEFKEKIKVMLTLLEPVMIIVVGGTIGLMIIAMMLPIFELNLYAR